MENITNQIIKHNYSLLKDPKFPLEDYLQLPTIDKIREQYKPLQQVVDASKLLAKSIEDKKKIAVVVDIDNDGISSGVVADLVLKHIFNLTYTDYRLIISSRCYRRGFNHDILNKLAKAKTTMGGLDLIVTADMGSPDESYYKQLKETYPGLKIIVTDHHQIPKNSYPVSIDYLVNPQQDDNTNYQNICGCCVLYELLRETVKISKLDLQELDRLTLPYVAIATVVDIMPMSDLYNRKIIQLGTKYINNTVDINIEKYRKMFNHAQDFNYITFGRVIGPLVNTANRAGKEEVMLYGLITDNIQNKNRVFQVMDKLNTQRKNETKILTHEASKNIDTRFKDSYVITLSTELHIGGLIAGKIADQVKRPVIVFTNVENKNVLDGSVRSGLQELDILSILKSMPESIVESANGHKQACGVFVVREMLEPFKVLLDKKVKEALKNITIPKENPTIEIPGNLITIETGTEIVNAGPYGKEWTEPLIKITDILIVRRVISIQDFYKLELTVKDNPEVYFTCMLFFSTLRSKDITPETLRDILTEGTEVELYCNMRTSVYRGKEELSVEAVRINVLPTSN